MKDKTCRVAARYLGGKTSAQAQSLRPMLENLAPLLEGAAVPRWQIRRWPVSVSDEGFRMGGLPPVSSRDLCRLFENAQDGLAVVCTLGADADALIRRELARDPARGAALGALASAYVDEVLDGLMEAERDRLQARKESLSPRFSPGYGDAPLAYQRPLLEGLEAWRIGVRLTEGCLMVPEKSVSALCAIRKSGECPERLAGENACARCPMTRCPYREELE